MAFFMLNNPFAPVDPVSYSLLSSLPLCGKPKEQICYIEADANPENGDQPVISEELISEFLTSLTKKKDTEHVFLKPR